MRLTRSIDASRAIAALGPALQRLGNERRPNLVYANVHNGYDTIINSTQELALTTVYFATNRRQDGTGPHGFGSVVVPNDSNQITYAVADVGNVQLPDESSGTISSIHDRNMGGFSISAKQQITASGRNLLVFIHGADNTFEDAITRAAFNREWFAGPGAPAANTSVVAFTWPSADFGLGNVVDGYKADKTQAGKSGFHILSFLRNIVDLRRELLMANPTGRVFLLAHSMGNHALQAGIQSWFESHGPNQLVFDQVFLAAPDETADTLKRPGGGGLSNLPNLSDRMSIYYSREDRLMWASTAVNGDSRLGFNGPPDKMDPVAYPMAKFRIIDCTQVLDYSLVVPWDASHQYYRRSPTVRADIIACMTDHPRPPGGLVSLSADVPPDHQVG